MKIACLGWGSLVWNPGDLEIENHEWVNDGPCLPIEFTRISSNNRVTLIIDIGAAPVQVLWNIMTSTEIEEALESLRAREGSNISSIHCVTLGEMYTDEIQQTICAWAKLKKLDAVIWTGLSYSAKTGNSRPTFESILSHLSSLTESELQEAKKYVLNAPPQIKTEYRKRLEAELGWHME